jgi:hypothetical protein
MVLFRAGVLGQIRRPTSYNHPQTLTVTRDKSTAISITNPSCVSQTMLFV